MTIYNRFVRRIVFSAAFGPPHEDIAALDVTAMDGALSSQAVHLTFDSHTYNRCSCRYTPVSPPSLNGAWYVYTPKEFHYFHMRVTSLEFCTSGLDSGYVFPDRILPVRKIGLDHETIHCGIKQTRLGVGVFRENR